MGYTSKKVAAYGQFVFVLMSLTQIRTKIGPISAYSKHQTRTRISVEELRFVNRINLDIR